MRALARLDRLVLALLPQHGHAAHVVAAEVEQHQVLGALLGIGQQLLLQRQVLFRRLAARAGAGDRADGDLLVPQAHQDLGAGAGQLEVAEVQIEHERRRVEPPQGAVEGERVELERRAEAMARHDLEDVAGADVLLGLLDDLAVVGAADGRGQGLLDDLLALARGRQRTAQVVDGVLQPHLGGGVGALGVDPLHRARRGDQHDLLADGIEHRHDRGPGHHRVRQAQRVGVHVRQGLDQAHHVVADRPEQAGGHGRQAVGQLDPRAGHQVAQGIQRAARLRLEHAGGAVLALADLGLVAAAAPHQVRLHRHDRIAAAPGAAFDRLEQEGEGPAVADLQIGRDRGLQVVDQAHVRDLGQARVVGGLERREIRGDLQHGQPVTGPCRPGPRAGPRRSPAPPCPRRRWPGGRGPG